MLFVRQRKKMCAAILALVMLLIALLYCIMQNAAVRSLQRIIAISADVHGSYSIISCNENMMDSIQKMLTSENSNDDIEQFCNRWNMSKEDYVLFSAEYTEYCVLEISIELVNDSDVYLHGITIDCDIQNTFVANDGFLFCDGPKLPPHKRALSESHTFILVRKELLNTLNNTDGNSELRVYCYSHPEGIRYDDVDIKTQLFAK